MKFGDYLRLKRKEHHYQTTTLAKLLGISVSYLSSLESGSRSAPKFEILEKTADILHLSSAERYQLFDLAAQSKKEPALANDLQEYILQTPNLSQLLRYAMECRLTDQDWKTISAFVKKNYYN